MAEVIVKNLVKNFGSETLAVDNVSFTVAEGEFVTLLGPSGCGKTTTLRCIAGLETPDSGDISIGGEVFTSDGVCLPPEKRHLGMVFQSYAIWPHMTVAENVAYGLQAKGITGAESKKKVDEALELVGLGGLGDRNATKLSGGQQQRVSLARAVSYNPRVLLFDEPLSNLDAKLRERMRLELALLVKELKMTALYVTHDQAEAMVMSDRIIVMKDGRIQQVGDPHSTYNEPVNSFVADFIGVTNILEGNSGDKGSVGLSVNVPKLGADIVCAAGLDSRDISQGSKVLLTVRPEYIELHGSDDGDANRLQGKVSEAIYLGQSWDCLVRVGETDVRVHVRGDAAIQVGQSVNMSIPPSRCVVLSD
ncbi:MAG: ABC transporter ATP-binding protein [Nitrospinaceae bacterium]|jgi:iron(III) transport system ATP-binding protein|nr:ABC transporter ATP-binding protein [Nitrospinaceae bacterium]MBT3435811.1 ABC transporter ATP-binding protein [Nitrospinaceae bacterium]MBT3821808.1 ABC transporter ATP-binding protein [Nitrospinaceae bacterium]MBT4095059.1 ABC transporter ATP-binding protein [Nitrospinaceae bacterium]MBT4428925.1 ABC transporter ATP-binding protein [Nitrospinaceae bacterium]